MKKTLLLIATVIATTCATANTMAAAGAVTAPVAESTASAVTQVNAPELNKIVKINGVEMTQAQARLVILQKIKNHRQMTPEEMTAYVNNLANNEANMK